MRTIIPVLAFIGLAAIYVSCKKGGGTTDHPSSFSWQINGGAVEHSDSTSFLSLFGVNILYGKKGTTNIFISTNSTNLGGYSHANANAGFGVTIAGIQYNPTSGNISISSNADRRLAGNFTSTLLDGSSNPISVSGSFSNIRY
jgi:hypothetical protein